MRSSRTVRRFSMPPTATRRGRTQKPFRLLELQGLRRIRPTAGSSGDAAGEPTGTLREDASELVASHLPKYTKAEYLDGLRLALRMANGFGITSLYEADASEELLEAYAELDRRGELTARVFAALHVDVAKGPEQVAHLVELRKRFSGRNLHADAVKIFADGVIEAHTAALLEPYIDTPGNAGKPNIEPAALDTLVIALDRAGFQIHIHAIGDRAIRMSLDAFGAARKANGPRDSRHHIAHLELIDPTDIPRFRELGVIANFQPLWAYADTYIKDMTEPQLGPARSRWLYPIGSVLKSGGMVVGRQRLVGVVAEPAGDPGGRHASRTNGRRRQTLDSRGVGGSAVDAGGVHDQRRVPRADGARDELD